MNIILDKIIAEINASISAALLQSRYDGKVIYGLTEKRMHKDVTAPCTVSEQGRITPIFLDSKIPLLLYHKINGTSFEFDAERSFGKSILQKATHTMSLVFFSMKTKTQLDGPALEQIIEQSMPATWSKTFKKNTALKYLNTRVLSCDHDAAGIYKKEWIGLKDPNIIPESSLIEVRYQIARTYKAGCAVNCCN